MILFFTITLVISIVGLVSLIALKHWELATGRVLSVTMRPQATKTLAGASLWVEHIAPALLRREAARLYRHAVVQFHRLLAQGILIFEMGLERLLETLRMNTQIPPSDASASAFLREVSAHKKALQQLSAEERTYEE